MFPIRDTIPRRNPFPAATVTIILVNAVIFLFQVTLRHRQLEWLVGMFGIIPVRYTHPHWASIVGFPHTYLPFLTSMFLHGGWFHIISNMWVLWIFGDNVEDRMGVIRFIVFYLICGVAAAIVHVVTNGSSTMPVIGASGAIAGVLAAYMALFPLARIVVLIPIFFYPLFVEVYAFIFVLIWFWAQFFNGTLALMTPGQVGGIAWWAHIGGFATGLILYRFFLARRPRDRRIAGDAYSVESLGRPW